MGDKEGTEMDRVVRGMALATLKRTSAISSIRATHNKAILAQTDSAVVAEFLVSVSDLHTWWAQFRAEDDTVLDCLVTLDKIKDYSPDLSSEVRGLINSCRAIADQLIPKGAAAVDLSYLTNRLGSVGIDPGSVSAPHDTHKPSTRLPEIPLPVFDGDVKYWPTFRDRFSALLDTRTDLSPIDKMYYLLGCQQGAAADAVRGIPVSADSYELTLKTLSGRFNRPRIVATSIVAKCCTFRRSPTSQ